ncbi:type I glyceraldehyde-3-phosphate dehydrogenase [Helicobacter pylori]|uniref:type I glyceraldehyde-3-phosphate dehydrogenase n=1 Tax=Helicobacter pylori TaxID=210 RepID=UPI001237BF32|nr:type I glyceraldehyde-3-phosphate dehydrogenase [Helicobacter pylori]KAA6507632.1 type I glyceraldehyde-3-phosphate dehydrogenase [Helicobacter pylori]KAA6509472.1 type I glyceraldehyde-3-phosphate dehydrogenase [Helicobacter pylori]KAA6515204.1 type I glyceraldehyde-3-phosphate dehydrogenase [Helicobacter pylori]
MPIKIAINGTGRIGLCTIRVASQRKDVEIVAINSTAELETLLHLIRHDSVHGHFEAKLNANRTLNIGHSKNILVLSERDINKLDFSVANAEIIIECTGKFNSLEASSTHLKNSVKKVIISAPVQNAPTFVYGVNHTNYHNESVISNASCTTNATAPLLKILDEAFKVENALLTTIHSYTNDQNLLDTKHKDIRRARAASLNLIPTSTGVSKAISLVLPHLGSKVTGLAIRVPTPNVSLVDLSLNFKKVVSKASVHHALKDASKHAFKGIVSVDEERLVSSDFISSPFSAIVIDDQIMTIGEKNAKVLAWYDNEMGYSERLIDMAQYIAQN